MSTTFNQLSSGSNFFLIAGPCVIEGEEMAYNICDTISSICRRLDIPYAFKGSYRKANRSRLDSFTGIGDLEALKILHGVGERYGVPVVTDIHTAQEASMAADFVDILQIPAFLCRQTDLLLAAAHTGKAVNVKKGQFLSPESMRFAVEKVRSGGCDDVAVTERGTTFGYGDLIVDFRGVPRMQQACQCPVIVDCTHSLQQPNTAGGVTGDYRDHSPRGHRHRRRRYLHRDPSRPGKCQERRRQYAPSRPARALAETTYGIAQHHKHI